MNLPDALAAATEIQQILAPNCIQCEIAGSIRRQKPEGIKDIEIVIVPSTTGLPHLHKIINSYWGRPISGVWPARYTKIRGARAIDLFTCTAESFGLNFFIRTGSADYAKNALIEWKRITNGGYSKDAQLHLADGTIVPTPTEQAVFDALKRPFLAPEKRL